MDKLITSISYYDSSLDFELDWRVPKLLDKTLELSKLFPNLTYKIVYDICFKDYAVFSEEPITASEEELQTWIEEQDEIMTELYEILKKVSPTERKAYYQQLSDLNQTKLEVFEAHVKKEELFTEVTLFLEHETLHTRFYTPDFLNTFRYWSRLTQEEFLDD